jgi:hypothetical protein
VNPDLHENFASSTSDMMIGLISTRIRSDLSLKIDPRIIM